MPSYLFTSIEPSHTFDLGTLTTGLIKSTVTDGVSVPSTAEPATTLAANDYQPGSIVLSTIDAVIPAGGTLLQADGTGWAALTIGGSDALLTSNGTTASWLTGPTTDKDVLSYNGANLVWGPVPTVTTDLGGTGLTTYTAGDTTYYASGTALTKLGIGDAGAVYISDGTAPSWCNGPSNGQVLLYNGAATLFGTATTDGGGTGLTSYTAGDLPYYAAGTALSKLAVGEAHTILASTGTAPAWVAPAAGSGNVLTYNGANVVWAAPATNGTVTSVGVSSSDITVGSTPVTTSGTITLDLNTVTTAKGGTGLTSYTAGDLVYYASGTALDKLAIGASGRILQSTGSAPSWVVPPYITVTTGGAADTAGTATITAGNNSVTVNTTAVAANSLILCSIGGLTGTTTIGAQGPVGVTSISAGANFVITGNAAVPGASTLVVHWLIVA